MPSLIQTILFYTPTPDVSMPITKATLKVVNSERIIKQPWKSNIQLTIIHPNVFPQLDFFTRPYCPFHIRIKPVDILPILTRFI